jgi:hypothetical protein
MGTIKQGILGGFSGKVGTVIGGSWKGISYMRSIPQSVHNPKTERQTIQRSKFTVAVQTLKPLTSILNIAWKENIYQKSPFNAAMSYTLKNAVYNNSGNWEIDYPNFCVSRGTLTPAMGASAAVEGGQITFDWMDNTGLGNAAAADIAVAAVINSASGDAIALPLAADRNAITASIPYPPEWAAGSEIHFYLGFVSDDRSNAANSVYLGSHTL